MTSHETLETLLSDLRTEPRAEVVKRRQNALDLEAGALSRSLVLFGAGNLGRQTARGLRQAGVAPLFFADNDPERWGSTIEGLEVLSPVDAARLHANDACFVVTIFNGSQARRQLRELGCRSVASYVPLFWKYSDIFIPFTCMGLPEIIFDNVDAIRAGYAVLADQVSRHVFREQLLWRVHPGCETMAPPSPVEDTYFAPELIAPSDDDVFADCGAFDGDSIQSFLAHRGRRFRHIYGLEPDPENREKLQRYRATLSPENASRFTILPYATGSENGWVNFAAGQTVCSHIAGADADGNVEVRSLDSIFAAQPLAPTFIKMDIEGAEPDAIRGARRVLSRNQPVLAACVYHRSEHLWEIPSLLHSISPRHRISLRRYAEDCWELVAYAIPEHRWQTTP